MGFYETYEIGGMNMGLNKSYGIYTLFCNLCTDEVNFEEFDEMIKYKKDNNWQSKKINGEWEDYCFCCRYD